ncbi:hypothetical protein RhiJN_13196 [Ceratobasidium sp. AG-Ba]|nr:hypothetical protein RhiJN_13196 [Ceratobasidium sp. AG-Ba]
MAYVCGLSEDILTRYVKDGHIKTEKKAKKGEANKEVEGKGKGNHKGKKKGKGRATNDGDAAGDSGSDSEDEDFARATIDDVKAPMLRHLKGLQSFRGALKRKFAKYQVDLFENALKYVGPSTEGEPKIESAEDGLGEGAYADEVDLDSDELEEPPESDHEPTQPSPRRVRPSARYLVAPHPSQSCFGTGDREANGSRAWAQVFLGCGGRQGGDAEHDSTRSDGHDEEGEEEEGLEPKAHAQSDGESNDEMVATRTPRTSKVAVVSSQTTRRFRPLFDDDEVHPMNTKDVEMANGDGDNDRSAEVFDDNPMDLDGQGPAGGRLLGLPVETGRRGLAEGTGVTDKRMEELDSPLSSPPPALPTRRKATKGTVPVDPAAEDLEDRADRMRQALEKLKNKQDLTDANAQKPGPKRRGGTNSSSVSGPAANTRRRKVE